MTLTLDLLRGNFFEACPLTCWTFQACSLTKLIFHACMLTKALTAVADPSTNVLECRPLVDIKIFTSMYIGLLGQFMFSCTVVSLIACYNESSSYLHGGRYR